MKQPLIEVLKDDKLEYTLFERIMLHTLCISLKGVGHAKMNYSELHRATRMHRDTVKKTLDNLIAKGAVVEDANLGYVVTDTRFCESPEKWVQAALSRQAQGARQGDQPVQRGIKGVNNNNFNFNSTIYDINKDARVREGEGAHGCTSGVHGATGQGTVGVQSCDPLDAVYTEDQEKFLKVYCKRPNNPAAFRRFFDIALEEVEDIDVLSRSAELYREKLKEQYEHLGYLPRPEKWLSDRGWCDYLKASNHYGLSTYVEEEGLAF